MNAKTRNAAGAGSLEAAATIEARVDWCLARLKEHARSIAFDPQANSVRALAIDLARALESDALALDDLEALARALCDRAFADRADRFRRTSEEARAAAEDLEALIDAVGDEGFDAMRSAFEHPRAGVVFTAHPTFAMSRAARARLAGAEAGPPDDGSEAASPGPITLYEEHAEALEAIARARAAAAEIHAAMLDAARRRFPDRWREITPQALSVATWVGYDLDGRTDIHWGQTLTFRLTEKAEQLERYAALIDAAPDANLADLVATLRAAAARARRDADGFAGDLNDPDVIVRAANQLTEEGEGRLTSLAGVIETLDAAIRDAASDEAARALILVKAEMAVCGLGAARVHVRVNAAQVRSALRADLDVDPDAAGFGRLAMTRAAERAGHVETRAVNFAAVFLEQMTARRQFMLCAQIKKHVDADTPIRFLIAECEAPATVMGAIYLARLYGVADRVDISPLFETPEALERGGRFMERLLDEPAYVDYVRARGRLAVQVGFSDSGRFMGQIAAALAVERFQVLLARALARRDIRDVPVILFDTHGESLGRGAAAASFAARLDHLFTPWARSRFDHEGVGWTHETSFQGGDGYLHFATDDHARTAARALVRHHLAAPKVDRDDPFYGEIDFSWDTYRALKAWQEHLFDDIDYRATLFAFAPNLLPPTGSRKARRPSADANDPRMLRAIPHNAILQQLAIPVNVACGLGSSVGLEADRFVNLLERSERARAVFDYAARARALTSLPALRAYAGVYDASFWMARASRSDGPARQANATLARRLGAHGVHTAMTRLANHVADDLMRFDAMAAAVEGAEAAQQRRDARTALHALHAARLALVMQAFLRVARLPDFSARHDVSRDDVIDLVLRLRIPEAVAILDRVFPDARVEAGALARIAEAGEPDAASARGYPEIQADIVRPLARVHALLLETSVGIAHHYGAFG